MKKNLFHRVLTGTFVLVGTTTTVVSFAQTSTSVENLTSISSSRIRNGLGFNVRADQNWEFQKAKDAGAVEVRFQPGWESVENMAGVFSLPPQHDTALTWCQQLGLQPLLVAAYGPPRVVIGTFTVAQNYASGATTIAVTENVSTITVPKCHVTRVAANNSNEQIVPEGRWAYYGALIHATDLTANTISLAAATNVPLTVGEKLRVYELRYPSSKTESVSDPSVIAYGNYVNFLAGRIAAKGIEGRVEIWNEPPWSHDHWDARKNFYDPGTAPSDVTADSTNFGFAHLIKALTPSTGVRFNWAGTHKSGANSLLGSRMSPTITAAQASNSISSESFHPYGNSPEDHAWNPTVLASWTGSGIEAGAALPGTNMGSNFKSAVKLNLNNPSIGLKQNITETGIATTDAMRKARFNLRTYLTYMTLGLERINFYRFSSNMTTDTYGFANSSTQVTNQAYDALKGLVKDDMAKLPVNPVAYTATDLPTVPSYSGTYPLTTLSIVGRRSSNDTRNSYFYVAWQRSHTSGNWLSLAQPAAASVTVQLPTGTTALSAQNLVSRASVPITVSGNTATYNVSDDPISLEVVPAFFDANFNADTTGSTPATGAYSTTALNNKPTACVTATGDTLNVVASLGGLTNKPVQFVSQGVFNYRPALEFVAPATTPLATAGKVVYEWDTVITSFTPTTHTTQTLLAHNLVGNTNGIPLSLNMVVSSTSGGFINFSPGNGQDSSPAWSFNTPVHFKVVLDLSADTYSAWANSTQFANNRALTLNNIQGLRVRDGNAVGGYDGNFTAAIDNIKIYTGGP